MAIRPLPAKAAYLTINNATKRNALSLAVLRSLRDQLLKHNTSPVDGIPRFLPPFHPSVLNRLEEARNRHEGIRSELSESPVEASNGTGIASNDDSSKNNVKSINDILNKSTDLEWLTSSAAWNKHRANLPRVLILRSDTDSDINTDSNKITNTSTDTKKASTNASKPRSKVFSSGHDLHELSHLSTAQVRETFSLCAQVMTLIRHNPTPIMSIMTSHQLATAAGAQLFLSTDLPIAHASAQFQLPGQKIGVPCSSPATVFARKLGNPATFRMLALAEVVRADELFGVGRGGAVEVVPSPSPSPSSINNNVGNDGDTDTDTEDDEVLERRVAHIIQQLITGSAGQAQALGKWAFWTQVGFNASTFPSTSTSTSPAIAGSGIDQSGGGGDGYEQALEWTGRVMALHARADDAKEGIGAFFDKRTPQWTT